MGEDNNCPECGEWKKEEYDLCFSCNVADKEQNGEICDCGNFKKPNFEKCYACWQIEG